MRRRHCPGPLASQPLPRHRIQHPWPRPPRLRRPNRHQLTQVEAAVAQAQTWGRDHNALTNTSLYESRIIRAITRHEKRLDELQRIRKTAEAQALQQVEDLLRLRIAKGQEIDQATDKIQVNGFDFSCPRLLTQMHRKDELEEAAYYKAHAWRPEKPWHGPAQNLPMVA